MRSLIPALYSRTLSAAGLEAVLVSPKSKIEVFIRDCELTFDVCRAALGHDGTTHHDHVDDHEL